MLCNKCGTEISEGKRFCKNCGWEDPICSDKEKHEIPVLSIEQVYSGNNNAVMQEVKNKDKLEGTQQSEEKTKPLKSTQKSSDKVKCSNCGAEILPSTAEKYGGWCAPCNRSPQLARERASRESTMEQSDFTNTAVNNGDIVATLLPIPRDFVEHPSDITRDELDGIVGGFAARCVKEGMLRKITLSISGYDNDPRELYEIPEVCAWARDTVKLFPSMPLFLDEV